MLDGLRAEDVELALEPLLEGGVGSVRTLSPPRAGILHIAGCSTAAAAAAAASLAHFVRQYHIAQAGNVCSVGDRDVHGGGVQGLCRHCLAHQRALAGRDSFGASQRWSART